MSAFPVVGCALLGVSIVMLLTPVILSWSVWPKLRRPPDLHHGYKEPVPRWGGLALALAFITLEGVIGILFPEHHNRVVGRHAVVFGSLAMFVVGFLDDFRPLGAKRKLAAQVVIAFLVYQCGIGIESLALPFSEHVVQLGRWGVVVTVMWLVGFTNLVNVIDGGDGLAGGICLMLMGLLLYMGLVTGTFVLLTAGMTGALLGFLRFNFPPARIYLGDSGAYFLGFQIGLFAIVNSHNGTIFRALWAPLFVLALPLVDTLLAILRRGLRGLPVFRPDRRHIHHRLLGMGMSSRRVALSVYAVTFVFLLLGVAAFSLPDPWLPLLICIAVLLLVLLAGKLSFSREWFAVGRTLGNSLAMRQDVHYALSLSRWLAHEGERCASLEELYADLALAARRLGFTSVKLTLADGSRLWEQQRACSALLSARHVIHGGLCGTIELQAPACRMKSLQGSRQKSVRVCARPCSSGFSDSRRFEILSELLAESWQKATAQWKPNEAPLRFDLPLPTVGGVHRRLDN